ncbi:MAG TPA: hypothetical protein VGS07_11585 [Thermoanaerobaculia bacterium]|nr:hypothetical protein [Thermoanaerobaculia bacterium]
MRDRPLFPRRKLVLLAALAFGLLAGCAGREALWQSISLAGAPAERAQFEGTWYDEEGEPRVIVSGDPHPHLDLRHLEGRPIIRMENAQTVGRELYFAVIVTGETPEFPGKAVLRLTFEDKGELRQIVADPRDTCCVCGCPVPSARLRRNPSPAWFGRIAARHTGEAIHKMREAVFDRLARVL